MTKQIRSKRVVAVIVVLVIAFSLSIQAYAAPWDSINVTPGGGSTRGSSSGTTGIMNSLYGQPSGRWPITIPPLPIGTVVTSVDITFTVSAGSDPCYIFIQSPNGTIVRMGPYGPVTMRTVTTNLFNGEYPSGTWYVWIQTLGTVSTVSYCRLVVNYLP